MALFIHPYILATPTPTAWFRTIQHDWTVSAVAIEKPLTYEYVSSDGSIAVGHKSNVVMRIGSDYAMSNMHKLKACANVQIKSLRLAANLNAITEKEAKAMGFPTLDAAKKYIGDYCAPSEPLVVFTFKLLNADRRGAN